jgi:DNA-binding response OmpR family regulator
LVVADTGTGIPPEALPQLFNRFYRVPGANGRTHEGSGIGLSLVRELIKLHGGSIEIESTFGRGSVFRVRIPFGAAHLPAAQVVRDSDQRTTASGAQAFVEEAHRWLPDSANLEKGDTVLALAQSEPSSAASGPLNKPTVLLVDDNRDMREYVTRLLQSRFAVVCAQDGQYALDLLDAGVRPDLVLSDVMMPRLDGFGLLKALRARPITESTPVIFLSARAGEEARLEGFDGGADDYLIKPFSARELITRVDTHIRLSRLRRAASEHIKMSEERLRIAIDEAGMGSWDLDLRTHELRWSRSHYTLQLTKCGAVAFIPQTSPVSKQRKHSRVTRTRSIHRNIGSSVPILARYAGFGCLAAFCTTNRARHCAMWVYFLTTRIAKRRRLRCAKQISARTCF